MTYPLLPAPRIAGLLPAVCLRTAAVPLTKTGQPDYPKLPAPRVLITTAQGTQAVLYEDQIGYTLALLARAGAVTLIGEPAALGDTREVA